MLVLIIGLLIFLGVHSAGIIASRQRAAIIESRGLVVWLIPYTVMSVLGFILIVIGYGTAWQEPVFLYEPPVWTKHLALVLMLPAFIFFIQARVSGAIAKALKHPQLVAVKLWSTAHLLANGGLASFVLFGSFLVWAVICRISFKKRVAHGLARHNAGGPWHNDVISIIIGLSIYVLFILYLHTYLFGVSPAG